jgi:hypothetical protein
VFKVEFYNSGECYNCKNRVANIHMARTARERMDRDYIDLCWKCWDSITRKVHLAFDASTKVADAEKATHS